MTRRILSIDGGGIKGVFPASFLATVEDAINDRIGNYFDLIVGTSTGGIIALGLGLGLPAKEILDFYKQLGPSIFSGSRFTRAIRQLGFSKYTSTSLKESLEAKFGERRLGESLNRLVIPSLNLETGEVHIYKTAHVERLERDYKERIVDVALATSAAPTYFPTHRSAAGIPLIDGGVWANNPVGLSVVEAIGTLGWPKESLKVLSLGCTTESLDIGAARSMALGFGYWGLKIVNVFMSAQSSASLGTAQHLAGHDNIIRISPYVPKGRFGLDMVKEINSLQGLGDSEARKALPQLRPVFFADPAEAFQPCRTINT
ncbi:MAG TPA: CBASS cGAMP-activated phospholipase [Pyrinomonadaceae bacterium]|jgi:hypothetical protein